MNALILLNKSLGLSSNRAMQQVKRLFQADKAGHTGALDPMASGMLPICLGEATKFAQYLLDADKTYEITGLLGIQTTTGDAEGEIIARHALPDIDEAGFLNILSNFKGRIMQKPPMFSALKHQGLPLYIYALKGIEIDRPAREIEIYELSLLEWAPPLFRLRVSSSKGSYMRTLVEDIGAKLACGAHVVGLHRLSSGGFSEDEMRSFDELAELTESERRLFARPVDAMLTAFQALDLDLDEARRLIQGQVLCLDKTVDAAIYRMYYPGKLFMGLAEYVPGRGLVAKRLCQYLQDLL